MNQLYVDIYPLSFRFFSHIGYYRVLSRVPCAIQQVLISYLFCVYVCVSVCAQLCLTLCIPMDCSPPGSSVHENFQARILEQVAIFFSKESPWPKDWIYVSCVSCIGRRVLYQLSDQRSLVCTCQSQSPNLLLPSHPLVTVHLFSTSMTLFLFCKFIRIIFLDSTCKWYYMILVLI